MDIDGTSIKLLFKDLKDRLDSSDWTVRERAVKDAGALFKKVHGDRVDNSILEKVLSLSGDLKWEVRKAVVGALYNSRSSKAIDILTELSSDTTSHVKDAALLTLVNWRMAARSSNRFRKGNLLK